MPTPVEVAFIFPPRSQLKPIAQEERDAWVKDDDIYPFYRELIDNESAFEVLNQQANLLLLRKSKQSKHNKKRKVV